MTNDIEKAIEKIEDHAKQLIPLISSEITNIFNSVQTDDSETLYTIKRLVSYMSERGDAIFCLLLNGCKWDAEILLRAYYEVFSKIILICLSDKDSQLKLIKEFNSKFLEINNKKMADKANIAAKYSNDISLSDLNNTVLFPHSKENKSTRKKIEHRWSFSGAIDQIKKIKHPRMPMDAIDALIHHYNISSTLVHANIKAMDLITDWYTRKGREGELLHFFGYSRIRHDQIALWFLVMKALAVNYSFRINESKLITRLMNSYGKITVPFYKEFNNIIIENHSITK
ncbi:MAG: DUF5677 domain-containing protein [Endomicrobiaceae bacterium]